MVSRGYVNGTLIEEIKAATDESSKSHLFELNTSREHQILLIDHWK